MIFPKKLIHQLNKRLTDNSLRELKPKTQLIDFSSNDYLGFSTRSIPLNKYSIGATGSRLLSGNTQQIENLEQNIANFHNATSGLIFNSGYTANLGLFATIPQRGDVILYDEYIHASIRDGVRLSNAKAYSFAHNSVTALEKLLNKFDTNVYVAIESVYSMTGDSPDLIKINEICKKHNAYLIVDEAHSFGLIGKKGEGLVAKLKLEKDVFATIITFGKSLGFHGAIILGSFELRNYLINFCRPFIYTTAPSSSTIETTKQLYKNIAFYTERKLIFELKQYFINQIASEFEITTGKYGAIIAVTLGDNYKTKKIAQHIQNKGLDVRPILSPTVPKGKECIRICFHSFNSFEEVNLLANSFNSFYEK